MQPSTTLNYGIDTSVFVRLLTGEPPAEFEATVQALAMLVSQHPSAEILVSNQVIGEAYITLQRFYQVPKADAIKAIHGLLTSGNLSPMNGMPVIDLLASTSSAGLMDRLIAQDYQRHGAVVLTNDRKMAKLAGVQLL